MLKKICYISKHSRTAVYGYLGNCTYNPFLKCFEGCENFNVAIMLPGSALSDSYNKPEIKLSSTGIEWKNFMNECLMKTEVFEKNDNENEKCLRVDPNMVMDLRHRMVKQSTKNIPLPQVVIHSEALKLLRIENHKKLLRQKEGRMVEKEIAKLKQMLENHRLSTRKKIYETINTKSNSLSNVSIFPSHTRLWKRWEFQNEVYNVHTNQCLSVKMMEPKTEQNIFSSDVKVFSNQEEYLEKFSEPISTQKGSLIENETGSENRFWEINEGKSEIMKRFLNKEVVIIKQGLRCDDVKEPEDMKKNADAENITHQQRMEHAWGIWKAYTQKLKSRNKEKEMYKNKIETFLTRLKENKTRDEKLKHLKNAKNLKQEIKANLKLEKRTKEEQINDEEKLGKLMKEIKMSQKEACQKLQEIRRKSFESQEKFTNLEFLKRMEERRTERLKRRKEIEEKKRKIEEEKEKIQRDKEEEKKRQEEEFKKKSLEELKEKRRLEKERKEEQKKEREKIRLKMRLAVNHYEKYLLHSYGLRPWIVLLKIRDLQNEEALAFFESRLKRKLFHKWMSNARKEIALKATRADAFYEKALKRKYLFIWILFHKEKVKQDQVAVDWNEFKITERAFKRWLDFIQDERIDYLNKKYVAELNYKRQLKMKCLTKLRNYPEFKKLELAKENRKRKWRQKVKEILPDYRPVDLVENF